MRLEINENKINMVFETTEDGELLLLHFSDKPYEEKEESVKKWFSAVEVHVAGKNQDDHHGAKHTVSSGSRSLKYVSHNLYENKYGKKLEIILEDDELRVTANYQIYNGISVVRAWNTVENISSHEVGIEYISSFSLAGFDNKADVNVLIPHSCWKREFDWVEYTLPELGFNRTTTFSSKRINISNSGTWSSKEYLPMGAVKWNDNALMWQIENNGSWQWEISDIADMLYIKLSGPTENENHWYKCLTPGECFEGVAAAVSACEDINGTIANLTEYRRRIKRKNEANAYLPVIFNDYMHCLWADPTEEKMLPVIDRAAEVGAEYYCMDAGWYADGTWWETVGEWQPCEWRFKNGIKAVFDYIKSKGIIPGIWLEIEVMGINSPILDMFDDECFFMRHGKRVIDHGRYQLDFRNKKVRDFATSVIDRVVGEYGVGYIKIDYNIDGGTGTEYNADSFGDGLLGHNRAYLAWIEEMMNKYPELIIENCSSGALRGDYAMQSIFQLISLSDCEDEHCTAYIAQSAGAAFLPEEAAVWAYPMKHFDEKTVVFSMVNAMLQRMYLSGEITKLDECQFSLVKEAVECYKNIRSDIKTFIPYYPDGIGSYTKDWLCTGYRCNSGTYYAIWRMDSEKDEYEIDNIENIKNIVQIYPFKNSGTFTSDGNKINVKLNEKYSAVIIKAETIGK